MVGGCYAVQKEMSNSFSLMRWVKSGRGTLSIFPGAFLSGLFGFVYPFLVIIFVVPFSAISRLIVLVLLDCWASVN